MYRSEYHCLDCGSALRNDADRCIRDVIDDIWWDDSWFDSRMSKLDFNKNIGLQVGY